MSESERIEIYNRHGEPAGQALRADAHRVGLWHRTLHCWVITGSGELLCQQRAYGKLHWPGQLDISAAGHLLAGETWQSALREADEELGLALTAADVVDCGERRQVLHLPGMVDRELVRTVFARADRPLGAYRLNPEVQALVAVSLDDAERSVHRRARAGRVPGDHPRRGR